MSADESSEVGTDADYGRWAVQSPEHLRWVCDRLVEQRRLLADDVLSIQKRAFLAVAAQWGITAFFIDILRSAPPLVQGGVVLSLLAAGATMFPTIWVKGSWEMSPKVYWDDCHDKLREAGVLLTAAEEHRDAVVRKISVVDSRGKWAQAAQLCAAVGVVAVLILAVVLGGSDRGRQQTQAGATAAPPAAGAPAPAGAGETR